MEMKIRNCQVVNINTKTHTVLLASKEDVPNAQRVIDEFFNKFEIIKIIPLVASKEIKPLSAPIGIKINPSIKPKNGFERTSVISQYLQIKDILKEVFTAREYYSALTTISNISSTAIYSQLKKLEKGGYISHNNTSPTTWNKIYKEPEPMPNMIEERKRLMTQTGN